MKLRFTIRDLLWLAVVAALAVALWVQYRTSNRQLEAATAEINDLKKVAAVTVSEFKEMKNRIELYRITQRRLERYESFYSRSKSILYMNYEELKKLVPPEALEKFKPVPLPNLSETFPPY